MIKPVIHLRKLQIITQSFICTMYWCQLNTFCFETITLVPLKPHVSCSFYKDKSPGCCWLFVVWLESRFSPLMPPPAAWQLRLHWPYKNRHIASSTSSSGVCQEPDTCSMYGDVPPHTFSITLMFLLYKREKTKGSRKERTERALKCSSCYLAYMAHNKGALFSATLHCSNTDWKLPFGCNTTKLAHFTNLDFTAT